MTRLSLLFVLSVLLVVPACGPDADTGSSAPTSTGSPYLLAADIADAVPVLEAKTKEAGEEVAVFGRVQQLNRDGYAVFFIVDESIPFCGKGSEDCNCDTPWDYCCEPDEMKAGRMPVELRGDGGLPVKSDDLGLRLLDLVAVEGTLEKTEEGGVILVAKGGWHRRERPDLPDGLEWPQ